MFVLSALHVPVLLDVVVLYSVALSEIVVDSLRVALAETESQFIRYYIYREGTLST